GLLSASCAGHGGAVPPVGSSAGQSKTIGAGSTRVASVATAPVGWATTATQTFGLANASDLGALAGSTPLTVRLGLQMRNPSQLQSLVASGQTVDNGTFMNEYAPTAQQVAEVTAYLQSQGFSNISAEPDNLLISADATAAVVQKAFDTTLHSFSQNGANVFANIAPAYVPQALSRTVLAVLGLNTAAKVKAAPITGCFVGGTGSAPCVRADYNPSTYWKTYDVGNTPTGSNSTIAVMAEGNVSSIIPDLRIAEKNFGLPQVPASVVQVGLPSPDTAGNDEWDLDTQASTGIAGNVKHLYIYATTSLTDSDIALEYSHWVTQDVAQIGNSSFGECEYAPYLDGSMLVDDEIMLEGAAHGQTMFASSGDTGSFCSVGTPNGVPAGAPLVEYPAASPYIVAVGGTTLLSNTDGSYEGEASWNAGGGGVSQFEYSPYWEQGIQPTSASLPVSVRGVPDVAMDADPNTGADVYVAGTDTVIGGTSLSSPLSAGVYARLQTAHGNRLGFAAPAFYKIYAENPTAGAVVTGPPPTEPIGGFHDILSGANGAYTALPRYDYTTGLGSFDIAQMNAAIGH
ncbi:MAG: S53 family peptidase, partial [Candidatus Baltobacteraceae bacterium]